MALLVPDVGEVALLTRMLSSNVTLKLYTSNTTPAESDTNATYTECTATGYTAKTLTGGSWTIGTSGGTSTAVYAEQTFTLTTSANVYGYYVVDGTTLFWAERFTGAPFAIPSGGGSVAITPRMEAA